MHPLIEALRPKHWSKNVLVFAGIIFAGRLFEPRALLEACVAFLAFCAAASATYLVNDLADAKRDALHPQKRERPIASGRLSRSTAVSAAVALFAASAALAAWLKMPFAAHLLIYVLLTTSYTFVLKKVAIVDTLALASGFVVRATAGAAAIHAEISPWLLCCSFLLSLFFALGKRRNELSTLGPTADGHRGALAQYSVLTLDGWLN